jgi:hypothetical protein
MPLHRYRPNVPPRSEQRHSRRRMTRPGLSFGRSERTQDHCNEQNRDLQAMADHGRYSVFADVAS